MLIFTPASIKSKQEFREIFNIKLGTILTLRKLVQYVYNYIPSYNFYT